MSKITCIDVSTFQPNVDYPKVKDAGIKAVIIRAGYGRETSQKDSEFEKHYKNAKAAGLKVGAYWYSYADSVADAEREANACLACIKGKSFDMPIYIDMEDSSQIKYGKIMLTAIVKVFCEAIKAGGYRAGVYANLNWFSNYLDYNALKSKYSIWLAQYNSTNQLACDIWQNSSTGKINGIPGNVDTNIIFNSSVISDTENSNDVKPTITYRVFADGKWYDEVKGLSGTAGRFKQAISGVAIKVSRGSVRYRVHLRDGDWLPWVTGYNINDDVSGYAGIKGKVIDAIQVEFSGVGSYKATYRVCGQGNKSFYDWQHDTEQDSKQDGYAGKFGKAIDRFELTLT